MLGILGFTTYANGYADHLAHLTRGLTYLPPNHTLLTGCVKVRVNVCAYAGRVHEVMSDGLLSGIVSIMFHPCSFFRTVSRGYTDHTHDYYGSHIPHSSPTLHTLLPLYTTLTTGDVPVQVYARLMPSTGEIVYRAVSKVIDHVSCACLDIVEFMPLSLSEVKESNVGLPCIPCTVSNILFTNPYVLFTNDSDLRSCDMLMFNNLMLADTVDNHELISRVDSDDNNSSVSLLLLLKPCISPCTALIPSRDRIVEQQLVAGCPLYLHAVGTISDGCVKPAHGVWEDHRIDRIDMLASIPVSILVSISVLFAVPFSIPVSLAVPFPFSAVPLS